MYLICGLGNPGREYEATRHNMGFITVDVLADRLGVRLNKLRFRALFGETRIGTEKVVLFKPQTYMNRSGEALREAVDFYKLPLSNLIVIYDDIDLPVGTVRIRPSGGSGTHNGMRSVIYQLGADAFPRVRIGTGKNGIIPLEKYVLGKWTEAERPLLAEAVNRAADACMAIVEKDLNFAMNSFNGDPEERKKEAKKPEGAAADVKTVKTDG